MVLAAPDIIAGLHASAAGDVIWEIERKRPVSASDLADAVKALDKANSWQASAERLALHAFLLVRQAELAPAGDKREALYNEATAVVERALARGPVQPHAWNMLAVLRSRAGDPKGAAAAVRLSMLSGAVAPSVIVWRLKTALSLLPWMDEDTIALLRRQIRITWVLFPEQVANIGGDPVLGEFVRQSLDDLSEDEINHYLRLHKAK